MEVTALEGLASSVVTKVGEIQGIIPNIALAALGVAVLIFGVKVGWRLVKSLARG